MVKRTEVPLKSDELFIQVPVDDQSMYGRLGTFAAILIARHCIPLQSFLINVIITSFLKTWNEVDQEAEQSISR